MHVSLGQVLGTALATGLVGLVVWFGTVPLRRRSVTGLIASVVLMGPLAVLGGIGWALMLGPRVNGPQAALELALVAVVLAALEGGVAAARAYRRFARSQRALLASVGGLVGIGGLAGGADAASDGRPLLSELEAVRADLSEASRTLSASRARDHALDESRRRLIAWVSQDLHAPLTVLRAMTETGPGDRSSDGVGTEIGRLVAVVDDLFDLATAAPDHTAGPLVLPRAEPTRLADVLGETVAAVEPLLHLRGVNVHVRGATTAEVRALGTGGDDLSRRMVASLVDAVRSSRPGSTVTLDVVTADDEVRLDIRPGRDDDAVGRVPDRAGGLRLPVVVPA